MERQPTDPDWILGNHKGDVKTSECVKRGQPAHACAETYIASMEITVVANSYRGQKTILNHSRTINCFLVYNF